MEMVLTGEFIDAQRAYEVGLVNKVVPVELYLSETVNVAKKIAAKSPIAVRMAKESVLQSFQSSLDDGLMFERKNFYMCFASEDQKEGMNAFVEKRKAVFQGK
jgi:enoyl-CoA hydratase